MELSIFFQTNQHKECRKTIGNVRRQSNAGYPPYETRSQKTDSVLYWQHRTPQEPERDSDCLPVPAEWQNQSRKAVKRGIPADKYANKAWQNGKCAPASGSDAAAALQLPVRKTILRARTGSTEAPPSGQPSGYAATPCTRSDWRSGHLPRWTGRRKP